jgi:hypothetical protein
MLTATHGTEAMPLGEVANRPAWGVLSLARSRQELLRSRWLAAPGPTIARLSLAATGFLPVTLIALTAFGVADLRVLTLAVLVPAVVIQVGLGAFHPHGRVPVLAAMATGIVATSLYDVFRFTFLWSGLMAHDPIPHIGVALHLHHAVLFGYLWRYVGNGAGLAVAFGALGLRGVRAGILFGVFVCAGLVLVLAVSPLGQQLLFPLNLTTIVMATGGHAIYGAVLGGLTERRHQRAGSALDASAVLPSRLHPAG